MLMECCLALLRQSLPIQWQGQDRSLKFALLFKDFGRRSLLLAVTEACFGFLTFDIHFS
jgi:hypothetical protein